MKSLNTLIMTVALASSAIAGPIATKNPKAPVMPPPPPACQCFEPGLALDIFGGAIIPDHGGEDALGGGLGVNYFFTQNIGVDFNYGLYATDSEHHQFDANLVLRAPIQSLCIAPYALVGGGFSTNSDNEGNYQVGGGLDIRFDSMGCKGVFVEGAYHFSENADFTTVRLGLRMPF